MIEDGLGECLSNLVYGENIYGERRYMKHIVRGPILYIKSSFSIHINRRIIPNQNRCSTMSLHLV